MSALSELKYSVKHRKLFIITAYLDKIVLDSSEYQVTVELSRRTPVRAIIYLPDLDAKIVCEKEEIVKKLYEKILELRREGIHVSVKQ